MSNLKAFCCASGQKQSGVSTSLAFEKVAPAELQTRSVYRPITKTLYIQPNPFKCHFVCLLMSAPQIAPARELEGAHFPCSLHWKFGSRLRCKLDDLTTHSLADRFALFSAAWLPGISKSLGWWQESNQPSHGFFRISLRITSQPTFNTSLILTCAC